MGDTALGGYHEEIERQVSSAVTKMLKMEVAQLKRKQKLKEDEENSQKMGISMCIILMKNLLLKVQMVNHTWIYLKSRQMRTTLRQCCR